MWRRLTLIPIWIALGVLSLVCLGSCSTEGHLDVIGFEPRSENLCEPGVRGITDRIDDYLSRSVVSGTGLVRIEGGSSSESAMRVSSNGIAVYATHAMWVRDLELRLVVENNSDEDLDLDSLGVQFVPTAVATFTFGGNRFGKRNAPATLMYLREFVSSGKVVELGGGAKGYERDLNHVSVADYVKKGKGQGGIVIPGKGTASIGMLFDVNFVEKGHLDFGLKGTNSKAEYKYRFLYKVS